ncbi:hypothetical protein FPOAC2_07723 [Fusarium poae]|uniref:hypothetical protein n=1 Tax=Fusarium poae TaxID=36050 RepID=UPI001CE8ACAD|nr:hypothetical protein FPOAC1_007820 [Fusarium poae]KAG8668441.1 hypothetical protein FPOAC1_007820 [Fusarium poae]
MPLPEDIAEYLFEDIQRLHIKIVSENYGKIYPDEERPDLIHRDELREFPIYLQNTLLPSVADQLVELTLAGKHWAGIPGEFNGRGLLFPELKTLTLDGFDILRDDQFNWVLNQKSLTSLHLHNCTIGTHCRVEQPNFAHWNVNLRDWLQDGAVYPVQRLEPGQQLQPGWYMNHLRWDNIFNSIQESLPLLQDFSFDRKPWEVYFRHNDEVTFAGEMELRYLAFSGRWFEPPRRHYYERSELQKSMPVCSAEELDKNDPTDRKALDNLVRTVVARRSGK